MSGIHTAQIPSQHEVKNEEAVFVVLERVSQINNEGVVDLENFNTVDQGDEEVTDLLKQPTLLNYVRNGLLTNTFGLVDVFESVELFRALVLDDTDLGSVR